MLTPAGKDTREGPTGGDCAAIGTRVGMSELSVEAVCRN